MVDIEVVEEQPSLPEIKSDIPKSSNKTPEKNRQGEDDAKPRKKLKLTADGDMPELKDDKNITVAAEEDSNMKGIVMDDKGKGKTILEFEGEDEKLKSIEEPEDSEDDEEDDSDDSDSDFSDGLDSDLEDHLPFEDDLDNFLPPPKG
ncbi:Hypothetical predicted protein [Olea europaea subsp. europaea]|uniref:Uncharacterized protein n=1 Tax=Olea europaea subsp. europaea TaxID=158383 RepID=A0A8S0SC65_OLEEU|nr:Hypothetical predicted protein [Olea europaea subsp. europaea]